MERKIFNTGDTVTAEFMTELTNTVVVAEENATEAVAKALQANETAQTAKANSEQVLARVDGAYEKATAVEERANNGEFNGKSIYIKYNTSPTDDDASETWQEGMDYIGFAISSDQVAPATGYRWVKFIGEAGKAGADIDLSGYVTVNTPQTITASKTFSDGVNVGGNWRISKNSSKALVFEYKVD